MNRVLGPLLVAVVTAGLLPAGPAPASPVAPVRAATGPGVVAGEYDVMLDADADADADAADAVAAAADRAARRGAVVRAVYPRIGGYRAALDPAALAAVRRDPAVAFVEPVRRMAPLPAPAAAARPAGAGGADVSWALDRIDQRDLPLDKSYTPRTTGAGVRVYVIDSGINSAHEEFTGRIEAGHTVIQDGRGTEDCFGHGTSVSSVAAGTRYGVAPKATIVPVRYYDCAGKDTEAGLMAVLEWVLTHARRPAVVNMSFANAGPYEAATRAITKMTAEGLVVVAAAGNFFGDACRWFPARIPELLTVAGSTPADKHFPYSDSGKCIDVYAPASNVVCASFTSPTASVTSSGTSLAAPLVVGAAAQYLQGHPGAGQEEVARELLGRAGEKIETGATTTRRLLYTGP